MFRRLSQGERGNKVLDGLGDLVLEVATLYEACRASREAKRELAQAWSPTRRYDAVPRAIQLR
jgi:hypothetical protein